MNKCEHCDKFFTKPKTKTKMKRFFVGDFATYNYSYYEVVLTLCPFCEIVLHNPEKEILWLDNKHLRQEHSTSSN